MIRPYLELMRPANAVTALADVLAGWALAGAPGTSALPWLLGAIFCLYAAGVVLNDVFDRDVDSVERPERPIPSRRIGAAAAARFGAVLLAAGIALAGAAGQGSLAIAVLIAAMVLLYDGWARRRAALGPVVMGLCRALSLLLGTTAFAGGILQLWPFGALPFVYVCAVTAVSRGEVGGGRRGTAAAASVALVAVLVVLVALALRPHGQPPATLAALALVTLLGWRVLPPFLGVLRTPDPALVRVAVRSGVLSLVLLDAVLATIGAGPQYGLIILALGGLAGWLARHFAVT